MIVLYLHIILSDMGATIVDESDVAAYMLFAGENVMCENADIETAIAIVAIFHLFFIGEYLLFFIDF